MEVILFIIFYIVPAFIVIGSVLNEPGGPAGKYFFILLAFVPVLNLIILLFIAGEGG